MEKPISIATSNVMFGGMAVKETSGQAHVTDWLLMHYMMLIAKSEDYAQERLETNNRNPAQELIEAHNPDLIVLNEVMPDFNDKIIPVLDENDYQVVIGRAKHVPQPMTRAAIIASRFSGEEIDFDIPGKAGSGSCGLSIPDLGLTILALHPSAFNKKIRQEQLEFTANRVGEILSEEPKTQIIVAGDFNTGGSELDPYFENLPLSRYSLPSFPHSALFQSLGRKKWSWLRKLQDIKNGQKDLDHIFIPSSWSGVELSTHETTSDHLALVMKVGI